MLNLWLVAAPQPLRTRAPTTKSISKLFFGRCKMILFPTKKFQYAAIGSSVTFGGFVFRSLPHSPLIHWSSCEMKTQRHSVGGCSFQWGFFIQWLFMTFFFPVNCFASSFVFFALHFSWRIFYSSIRLLRVAFMACVASVCVTTFCSM